MDNAKPHVILFAYLYPPHREIGSLRPYRFCKYLERMGYSCHVITATPQPAPDARVTVIPDELGGIWEGETGGRLGLRGYFELFWRHAMFPGQIGFVWSRAAARECRRIVAAHPSARFVLFSTYPPLGALLAGFFAASERTPWICDFRDPLAALVYASAPRYESFLNRVFERRVFRKTAAIIANTEPAAREWQQHYPWARAKLHAIYNGYDPEQAPSARPIPARDYKLLVHAGTIYPGRNPNALIEGLARLRSQGEPDAMRARVLLLGSTIKSDEANWTLYEQAQRDGWLVLRATVPRPEAQAIVAEADALLIIQPHTSVQVPGKLFEYICIGRPVLAIVPRSSPIEEILVNSGVPHTCLYPDEPPEISDRKLLEFLRLPNTPANANDWFRHHFNVEAQTATLARIIDAVAVK